MTDVEIIEKDITGLLEKSVTICNLQIKSPFFDECRSQLVGGYNVLTWDSNKYRKRREKILSILDSVKKYREDINIIILPEYSIHYEMLGDLQDFANSYNVILIGSYYDDRSSIEKKENPDFRKNICSVIFPNNSSENIAKLNKTSYEGDFLEEPASNDKKLLRFFWEIDNQKLCLQIFICADYLNYFDNMDKKHAGIIIIPACSQEIDEFKAVSKLCIRSFGESKVNRCVFVCNAVSLPKQETDLHIIGNSQIFGPYKGKLPILNSDIEGGIIATVVIPNLITKPSSIPSKFNVVIENPLSFLLTEKDGKWIIEEKKRNYSKNKYILNPNLFKSLGLSTYITFAKLKSYYNFRSDIKKSLTKCYGVMGADDIVISSIAEETSDSLFFSMVEEVT